MQSVLHISLVAGLKVFLDRRGKSSAMASSLRVEGIEDEQLNVLRFGLRAASSRIPLDSLEDAERMFLELLARPYCRGLAMGYTATFVLFGPPIVDQRFVLLPACVTDRAASRRGTDFLTQHVVPHVTVGMFVEGMGCCVGAGDALEWHVTWPNYYVEGASTPTWSRVTRFIVPIQKVLDAIARELLKHRFFTRPIPCCVHFDSTSCRWELDDGIALEMIRLLRAAVERYFRRLDAMSAFQLFSPPIHITSFYEASPLV